MLHRRQPGHVASQEDAASAFDRFTLQAFAFTVTVAVAVALGYGPGAALRHIADVLAAAGSLPLPDESAWSGQMVF